MKRGHVIYTHPDELSKWDRRFIELAEQVASWSKGPRKRIGAAIVRPDRSIASLGYNGPPRGFDDEAFLRMTREEQHAVVIHAEANAIAQAHDGEALAGYTLYVSPLFPCAVCARRIVDAGIRRVVAYCGHISPDWRASADEAEEVFIAAGVECLFSMD
ncbi:dCMP deaminase [Stenotrophomonas phage vB_SmaS_Bhz58]